MTKTLYNITICNLEYHHDIYRRRFSISVDISMPTYNEHTLYSIAEIIYGVFFNHNLFMNPINTNIMATFVIDQLTSHFKRDYVKVIATEYLNEKDDVKFSTSIEHDPFR